MELCHLAGQVNERRKLSQIPLSFDFTYHCTNIKTYNLVVQVFCSKFNRPKLSKWSEKTSLLYKFEAI